MCFDFGILQRQFITHCTDYTEQLNDEKKSLAVEFTSKMIYKVGRDPRKVKPGQGNRRWRIVFTKGEKKHTVFVLTYKTNSYELANDEYTKILSLKQASLLAMETLNRAYELAAKRCEYCRYLLE